MSATIGTSHLRSCSPRTICCKLAASFTVGAVMRTISQPTSANSIVCAMEASVSIVSQVIIDWTRIGLSPQHPRSQRAPRATHADDRKTDPRSSSLFRLDLDRRSVTKNLGHALHDLGCVIAQADDGVRAQLLRMLQTKLERVLARFLTELGENGDVTPDQGLQSRANRSEN